MKRITLVYPLVCLFFFFSSFADSDYLYGNVVVSCLHQDTVSLSKSVDSLMQHMSWKDKAGQLFTLDYGSDYSNVKAIKKQIRKYRIGGLILMESSLDKYVAAMNFFQSKSRIPLAVSIDGEWGAAMRFDTLTAFPHNQQMGAVSSKELVYEVGKAMAQQFKRLGIHINYAPSVDVNNNPGNQVIGTRSFGDDREKVADYGTALMHGMQDAGVLAVAKHFPGHGDTDVDSHKAMPLLPFNRKRLDSLELYPFKRLIKEGVAMVMVAHLNVPALDPEGRPSSISYPVITKTLKEDLGYKGIVVTDALEMKGVVRYVPQGTIPIAAFNAGSDILLMPPHDNKEESIRLFFKAVRKGQISKARVDESVRKILMMKAKLGILNSAPEIQVENLYKDLESPEVLDVIRRTTEASITMIKAPSFKQPLSQILTAAADTVTLSRSTTMAQLEAAKKKVEGKDYAVVFLPRFREQKNNRQSFTSLSVKEIYNFLDSWALQQKVVLAIMDTPYVLDKINWKNFDGVIIGYNTTDADKQAVISVLGGKIKPVGVLPVSAGGLPTGYSVK